MFLLWHPNAPSVSPGTPGDAPGTILSPGRRSRKGPKTRYFYDAAQNRVFGFCHKVLWDYCTFQDRGGMNVAVAATACIFTFSHFPNFQNCGAVRKVWRTGFRGWNCAPFPCRKHFLKKSALRKHVKKWLCQVARKRKSTHFSSGRRAKTRFPERRKHEVWSTPG